MTSQHENVITFDADDFEREVLRSERPVLVDFGADWCPPCNAIAPGVEQIATDYAGTAAVGKVHVDVSKALAERYAISSIPAFLFFKNGEVVDRVQGLVSKSTLSDKLAALVVTTQTHD